MPLQKTNLGAPTKRCPENMEYIDRTPTPKCDKQSCIATLLKLHFGKEVTPQTSRLLLVKRPIVDCS